MRISLIRSVKFRSSCFKPNLLNSLSEIEMFIIRMLLFARITNDFSIRKCRARAHQHNSLPLCFVAIPSVFGPCIDSSYLRVLAGKSSLYFTFGPLQRFLSAFVPCSDSPYLRVLVANHLCFGEKCYSVIK